MLDGMTSPFQVSWTFDRYLGRYSAGFQNIIEIENSQNLLIDGGSCDILASKGTVDYCCVL